MNPLDQEKLEAAIHRALHGAPGRRAPASLEGRVLAELSRRAALPWWRQSFIHWPMSVRVAFFAGSAVAAALLVTGLASAGVPVGVDHVAGDVAQRFAWLVTTRDIVLAVCYKVRLVAGAIPPLWFYGIAGTIAACYATLGAIGAVTYRALSVGRQTQ